MGNNRRNGVVWTRSPNLHRGGPTNDVPGQKAPGYHRFISGPYADDADTDPRVDEAVKAPTSGKWPRANRWSAGFVMPDGLLVSLDSHGAWATILRQRRGPHLTNGTERGHDSQHRRRQIEIIGGDDEW